MARIAWRSAMGGGLNGYVGATRLFTIGYTISPDDIKDGVPYVLRTTLPVKPPPGDHYWSAASDGDAKVRAEIILEDFVTLIGAKF